MVPLPVQGVRVAKTAEAAFTSPDRVRDVIHDFSADGFRALRPKREGGRPQAFTPPGRREIKKIAKSGPAEHDLPSSPWSPARPADRPVAEGAVDEIGHEGFRSLLREEAVSFRRLKTRKASKDPDRTARKVRVEHLYVIADGEAIPEGARSRPLHGWIRTVRPPSSPRPPVDRARRQAHGSDEGPGRGGVRPALARMGPGICSPSTSWARTSSAGTSRRPRTGRSVLGSAATRAVPLRSTCASPSSAATSPRTWPRNASAERRAGRRLTASGSPAPRPGSA